MLAMMPAASAFTGPVNAGAALRTVGVTMETKEQLATALNPAIGYFDPMGLADADFWSQGNEATWGFLRHAEIKHGRVAMFAFCGYVAQANGAHMPWDGFLGPLTTGATPEEQWLEITQGLVQPVQPPSASASAAAPSVGASGRESHCPNHST